MVRYSHKAARGLPFYFYLFDGNRLAIVGHRGAQLLDHERLKMFRKFHHPSNPYQKIPKGQPGYDNLHQVEPTLSSFLKLCRDDELVANGEEKSADEETLAMQAAAADDLKQNFGKYKAAGDGLQADCVCLKGGGLRAFAFRNHSLLHAGTGQVPRAAHHGRHREVAPNRRTETTIPLDTSRHTAETRRSAVVA